MKARMARMAKEKKNGEKRSKGKTQKTKKSEKEKISQEVQKASNLVAESGNINDFPQRKLRSYVRSDGNFTKIISSMPTFESFLQVINEETKVFESTFSRAKQALRPDSEEREINNDIDEKEKSDLNQAIMRTYNYINKKFSYSFADIITDLPKMLKEKVDSEKLVRLLNEIKKEREYLKCDITTLLTRIGFAIDEQYLILAATKKDANCFTDAEYALNYLLVVCKNLRHDRYKEAQRRRKVNGLPMEDKILETLPKILWQEGNMYGNPEDIILYRELQRDRRKLSNIVRDVIADLEVQDRISFTIFKYHHRKIQMDLPTINAEDIELSDFDEIFTVLKAAETPFCKILMEKLDQNTKAIIKKNRKTKIENIKKVDQSALIAGLNRFILNDDFPFSNRRIVESALEGLVKIYEHRKLDRSEVADLLGYTVRHINRLKNQSFQKIKKSVIIALKKRGYTLEEVAEIIGLPPVVNKK